MVNYVEAHGTGTRVGDPEELNAIDKVFCPGRKTPLKIGSGKSNFGHAEPASGLCSIAKVSFCINRNLVINLPIQLEEAILQTVSFKGNISNGSWYNSTKFAL